jgi:asparagine synthase (glutamine-hydrolysing)
MKIENENYEIILERYNWKMKDNKIYNVESKISTLKDENLNIISINEKDITIKSDTATAIPLFYTIYPKLIITDNPFNLLKYHKEFCEESLEVYFNFKIHLNRETIIKNIYRVKPGEKIIFKDFKKLIYEDWFLFGPKTENTIKDFKIAKKELDNVLNMVFKETFDEIKKTDQNIILFLSGGYDSRLIAYMIAKYGLSDRTIAVTYGDKDINEKEVARSLAEKLGFKWYFVEFKKEDMEKTITSDDFKDYVKKYFNLVGHQISLDIYYVLKKLIEQKIINKGDFITAGHTGIIGSGHEVIQLSKYRNFSLNKAFYQRWSIRFLKKGEYNNILKQDQKFNDELLDLFYYKNHISAKILNEANYFELNKILPLMDYRILSFFNKVDNSLRQDRKNLYHSVLSDYFEESGLNFKYTHPEIDLKMKLILKFVEIMPDSIKVKIHDIKDIYRKHFVNMYNKNKMNIPQRDNDKRIKEKFSHLGYGKKFRTSKSAILTDYYFELFYEILNEIE